MAELRLPLASRSGARAGDLVVRGRAPRRARDAGGMGRALERRIARGPAGRAEWRRVGRDRRGVGPLHAAQVPALRPLLRVPGPPAGGRSRRSRRESPLARLRSRGAHGVRQLAGGGGAAPVPPAGARRGAPPGRRRGDAPRRPGGPARRRPAAGAAREERARTAPDAPVRALRARRSPLRGEPRPGAAESRRRAGGGAPCGGDRVHPARPPTRPRVGDNPGAAPGRRVSRRRRVATGTGSGARQPAARVLAALRGRGDDRRPADAGRSVGAAGAALGRAAGGRAAAPAGRGGGHRRAAAGARRPPPGAPARAAGAPNGQRLARPRAPRSRAPPPGESGPPGRGVARRLQQVAAGLIAALRPAPGGPAAVRWLERRGRKAVNVSLAAVPLDLAPILKESLFDRVETVVLTSATLAAGGDFGYLEARLGLDLPPSRLKVREIHASPFDFAAQCLFGIPTDFPEPRDDEAGHDAAVARVVVELAHAADGGMFVLFTSHGALRRTAEAVRGELGGRWPLLVQGDGQRDQLLRRFRDG